MLVASLSSTFTSTLFPTGDTDLYCASTSHPGQEPRSNPSILQHGIQAGLEMQAVMLVSAELRRKKVVGRRFGIIPAEKYVYRYIETVCCQV